MEKCIPHVFLGLQFMAFSLEMIQSSTISTCSPDTSTEGPVIHSWDFHTCGRNYSHLSQPQISFLWGISLPVLGLRSDQNKLTTILLQLG